MTSDPIGHILISRPNSSKKCVVIYRITSNHSSLINHNNRILGSVANVNTRIYFLITGSTDHLFTHMVEKHDISCNNIARWSMLSTIYCFQYSTDSESSYTLYELLSIQQGLSLGRGFKLKFSFVFIIFFLFTVRCSLVKNKKTKKKSKSEYTLSLIIYIPFEQHGSAKSTFTVTAGTVRKLESLAKFHNLRYSSESALGSRTLWL